VHKEKKRGGSYSVAVFWLSMADWTDRVITASVQTQPPWHSKSRRRHVALTMFAYAFSVAYKIVAAPFVSQIRITSEPATTVWQ